MTSEETDGKFESRGLEISAKFSMVFISKFIERFIAMSIYVPKCIQFFGRA